MSVIRSGVRQGSVLSPILFNLYMNDLANINPDVNRVRIILYADDILLIAYKYLTPETAKRKKTCYCSATHRHYVNVMQSNIIVFLFLQF